MRPIDADALMKELEELWEAYKNDHDDDGAYAAEDFSYIVRKAPSIPFPQWISVKDRLPDPIPPSSPNYPPHGYLICDSLGYMYVADYTYDKYFPSSYSFHVNGEEETDVKYWMVIEPPEDNM